jgi:hypothetical protein
MMGLQLTTKAMSSAEYGTLGTFAGFGKSVTVLVRTTFVKPTEFGVTTY